MICACGVAAAAVDAGLTVTTQEFDVPFLQIQQRSADGGGTDLVAGTDLTAMTFAGSGDVTSTAVPVHLQLPPAGTSTSGCEAEDLAGLPAGEIA